MDTWIHGHMDTWMGFSAHTAHDLDAKQVNYQLKERRMADGVH